MAVSFQVCAACLLVAQTSLPALPRLALDSYSPAARDAISRAYQDATARSTDPVAVGTLARTLHAWEQWSAAHDVYARAQALAPRAFEWLYLDALVLQRLARHADAAARLEQALRLSPDYLPARVALAESLLESGDLERSQQLFDALRREPAAEPAAEFGLGRIARSKLRAQPALTARDVSSGGGAGELWVTAGDRLVDPAVLVACDIEGVVNPAAAPQANSHGAG